MKEFTPGLFLHESPSLSVHLSHTQTFYDYTKMTTSSVIFSIQGSGLKLDTRADILPILADYDPAVVEEIHFGGNTIGIEASQALAEFLGKTQVLKVRLFLV